MSKKQLINFDISEIADGGVQVKLTRALQQVAQNVMDPNTDPKKKRSVTLKINVTPDKKRNAASITAEVKTNLAPEEGVETTMLLGRDGQGQVHVNELKSGVPGQTYIDAETGELKTDTGKPVAEVEKEEAKKVVDLRKKESN